MPTCRLLSLLSGLALLVVPAAASAAPASVTVQVESKVGGALVAPTTLTTADGEFSKDGDPTHLCSKTSAAGALEQATTDWTSDYGSFGYSVIGIRGEAHPFSGPDFWALYVNGAPSASGACTTELQPGDRVLFAPSCTAADAGRCFTGSPLALSAPATVKPGVAFSVGATASVTTFEPPDFSGTTVTGPAAGAIVSGGATGVTTDAQGKATVTLTARGPAELVVRGGDNVPDRKTVCVTDGADGFCGTTAPVASAPSTPAAPVTPAAPCVTRGDDGLCGTADSRAPVAKLTGIANGRTYKKTGPRTIAGSVGEVSSLKEVRLRLTRNDNGTCSQYSFRLERFIARKTCSTATAPLVSIGNRAEFSYQLPSALGRGRYVLDVIAVDTSGNADHLVRGRTRVVFRVG